eukprot:gene25451-biopygen15033
MHPREAQHNGHNKRQGRFTTVQRLALESFFFEIPRLVNRIPYRNCTAAGGAAGLVAAAEGGTLCQHHRDAVGSRGCCQSLQGSRRAGEGPAGGDASRCRVTSGLMRGLRGDILQGRRGYSARTECTVGGPSGVTHVHVHGMLCIRRGAAGAGGKCSEWDVLMVVRIVVCDKSPGLAQF